MLISRGKSKLVIWHNLNYDKYYARLVTGYYQDYYVGYINQYNHKIVLVLDLEYYDSSLSFRQRFVKKLINYLKRFE